MKNEDKNILLQNLCSLLPYGVKVKVKHYEGIFELRSIHENGTVYLSGDTVNIEDYFENCKPYLFPLSNMTEKQRIELYKVLGLGYQSHYHLSKEWEDFNDSIDNNNLFLHASWISDLNKMFNWLLKNKFDIFGLLSKWLAEDATDKKIYLKD